MADKINLILSYLSPTTEDSPSYAKENQDTLETFKLKGHRPTTFYNLIFLDLDHDRLPKTILTPLPKFQFDDLEGNVIGQSPTYKSLNVTRPGSAQNVALVWPQILATLEAYKLNRHIATLPATSSSWTTTGDPRSSPRPSPSSSSPH
jgi:hypothetical protein